MRLNGLLLVAVGIRTTGMNGLVLLTVRPNPSRAIFRRSDIEAKRVGFAVGNSCRHFCLTSHNVY